MVETQIHQITKNTWNKWSFYINIIVFVIIAIAFYLMIRDSYEAGRYASSGATILLSNAWIYVMRDAVIIAICLTFIFGQLFRNQLKIMRRSL